MKGMLWYDGTKRPFDAKVQDAVKHYQYRNGKMPGTITVNPKTDVHPVGGLKIEKSAFVQINHFVVGE